jgi:hypothetical protein
LHQGLEDEGIYVWLDLHAGRQLKPADEIDGFGEISKGKPTAELLYRRGDVEEARITYMFAPAADQLFNQLISPKTSAALCTAVDKSNLIIAMPQTRQLPWLEKSEIRAGEQLITDPNQSLINVDATYAISDTGELARLGTRHIYD